MPYSIQQRCLPKPNNHRYVCPDNFIFLSNENGSNLATQMILLPLVKHKVNENITSKMPRLATTKQRKTCTNHGRAFSQAVNWKLLLHVASRKGAEQRRRASTRVVLQLHHLCSSCCRTAVPAFFLWPIWSFIVADMVLSRGRYCLWPIWYRPSTAVLLLVIMKQW